MDGRESDPTPGEALRFEVPDRLERARKIGGFETLKELHQALTAEGSWYEVSYPTVLNYHGRSKRREPTLSYLTRVADVTGVRLAWLVTGEGDMVPDRLADDEGQGDAPPGFTSRLQGGLERARRQNSGGFERTGRTLLALPGRFVSRLPFVSKLNPAGTALLKELATQLVSASAAGEAEGMTMDDVDGFAHDVAKLMELPYEKLGFPEEPSSYRYGQYLMALIQALMIASPRRGEGPAMTTYPMRSKESA